MDISPEATKAVPGILGALSAVLLMRSQWQRGVLMIAPAVALTYYSSAWVAEKAGMPEGLAGFLIGLFGMAAAAKVLETWEKFDLGGVLGRVLARVLGVKED